jgi:hypothetical protein
MSCDLRDVSRCEEISDLSLQNELLEILRPEIEFTKENGYVYRLEALIESNSPTFLDCSRSYAIMFTPRIYPPEAGIVVTGSTQQFLIDKVDYEVRGPFIDR